MPYYYQEETGCSDLFFTAEGRDLNELFTSCWDAAVQATVENTHTIQDRDRKKIKLNEETPEFLLYDFLDTFIYYKDAEGLVLRIRSLEIMENKGQWELKAHTYGEPIDIRKHGSGVDIKAVTFHQFSVERIEDGTWRAQVLMDI